MATTETKILDNIISSRRAMMFGAAALATAAVTSTAHAALTPATISDTDILNFALNLEYLEANFYYLAAFGCLINAPNQAAIGAGAPAAGIGIGAGTAAAGIAATFGTGAIVPFATATTRAYAIETAIEEGKHVILLRGALAGAAVAQPALDISPAGAFTTLSKALTPTVASFNPYASDLNFLIGAYVFEDVGVTAYHGAAPLITSTANLGTAASILAVEAYHAGLLRTSIGAMDPNNAQNAITLTQSISALRATLSNQAKANALPDDIGLAGPGISTIKQTVGTTSVTVTQIVDADANVVAFSRTTNQVLNIVTGGGALTAGVSAKGVFFPNGMNGNIA